MKKLLLGSAVLTALSLSIIAFQLSCVKTANAQTNGTSGIVQLNKIVYVMSDTNTTSYYPYAIYIANYDGSNATKININLPSGIVLSTIGSLSGMQSTDYCKLSPDGKTIFFRGYNTSTSLYGIYSCNVDGSNGKKVIELSKNEPILQSVN